MLEPSNPDIGFRLTEPMPAKVGSYPQIRFMGSKFRLLPWIYEILCQIDFNTAADAFSGSGCVSYLFKCMGKRVISNDFLNFCATIAAATTENPGVTLSESDVEILLSHDPKHSHFIEQTFSGIFFTPDDLRFLDRVWGNIPKLNDPYKRTIAISAMIRSCAKRQPRGVFTVAGDPKRYKDGRRDLQLSLPQHFREHIAAYNRISFNNGKQNKAIKGDVFDLDPEGIDLVYMDPPYVPRADDNCYIKRYHFLEGLSCYWDRLEILAATRVKKIKKPFTPFSYRKTALEAFDRMFSRFSKSVLVLSYSSNGYPDLDDLVHLMKRCKTKVYVYDKPYRYHFGTHDKAQRNEVFEFLVVGF